MELESLKLVDGGAPAQTAKALENLTLLLKESGSGVDKVVKTTILLANMDDYAAVNDEYKRGKKPTVISDKSRGQSLTFVCSVLVQLPGPDVLCCEQATAGGGRRD